MEIVKNEIKAILSKHQLSVNKLAQIIGYNSGSLNKMVAGEDSFPEHVIEKLLPILEVSKEEFKSWILADKYPKKALELAVEAEREMRQNPELYANKLVLTVKIDEILKEKGLSRTVLSKIINQSQSGLNRIIIGKETLSRKTVKKLSIALNISEERIMAWNIVGKYDIKLISLAIKAFISYNDKKN